jgi:hypothetical protein
VFLFGLFSKHLYFEFPQRYLPDYHLAGRASADMAGVSERLLARLRVITRSWPGRYLLLWWQYLTLDM